MLTTEILTADNNRYSVEHEYSYGQPLTFYGPTGVVATSEVLNYQRIIILNDGTTLVRGAGEPYTTFLNLIAYTLGETIQAVAIPTFEPETLTLILSLKKGDVIQVTGNPYAFLDGCKVFASNNVERKQQTFNVTLTDDFKTVRKFNKSRGELFDSVNIAGHFKFSGYNHTFHLAALVSNIDYWERSYGMFTFDKVVSRA